MSVCDSSLSCYEAYCTVCLIAGHVYAADCSVTRLIWQAAEARAWFVIKQTARMRKKKKEWDVLLLPCKLI